MQRSTPMWVLGLSRVRKRPWSMEPEQPTCLELRCKDIRSIPDVGQIGARNVMVTNYCGGLHGARRGKYKKASGQKMYICALRTSMGKCSAVYYPTRWDIASAAINPVQM